MRGEGGRLVGVVAEIFYVLFFNIESAVISGTAAVASSPFPVSAVTDRGLTHGFW